MTSTELQKMADSIYPLIAKARQKADCAERSLRYDFEITADHIQIAFNELSNAAEELAALESKGETL